MDDLNLKDTTDDAPEDGYQLADLSRAEETQGADDGLRETYIALSECVRQRSVDGLNQLLVDTIMLRDLYKKHHWQLSGPTFYQLHLLFDEHYETQAELVDALAERVQILGGVAIGMPDQVADLTHIDHPPRGREEPEVQITRLLGAHRTILGFAQEFAAVVSENGDTGTEDLVVSQLIVENEKQAWFIAEHLA